MWVPSLVGPFQLRTSCGSKRFSCVARERGGFPSRQLSLFHTLLASPARRFLLTKPDSHHELPARSVILTQRLESSVTSGMQSRGGHGQVRAVSAARASGTGPRSHTSPLQIFIEGGGPSNGSWRVFLTPVCYDSFRSHTGI